MTHPSSEPASSEGRPAPPNEYCTWAMIAHLSGFVPVVGFILGPLLIWLSWRDHSAFVAAHAKEALNFNLTVGIAALACGALVLVGIGVPLLVVLFLAWVAFTLVAAVRASEGSEHRYPVSLRLVR